MFAGALALVAVAVAVYVVVRRDRLPAQGSPVYEEATRSFYRGLASLHVGLLDQALQAFARTTELVPPEPAAWANLGLTNLRLGEFDAAAPPIERAAALAPESSAIAFLQGQLETARGQARRGHRASQALGQPRSAQPARAVRPRAGDRAIRRTGR